MYNLLFVRKQSVLHHFAYNVIVVSSCALLNSKSITTFVCIGSEIIGGAQIKEEKDNFTF